MHLYMFCETGKQAKIQNRVQVEMFPAKTSQLQPASVNLPLSIGNDATELCMLYLRLREVASGRRRAGLQADAIGAVANCESRRLLTLVLVGYKYPHR